MPGLVCAKALVFRFFQCGRTVSVPLPGLVCAKAICNR
ncbi:hypothetical protein NIES2104_23150 [Leptolyngbya sp. NIES-2104]|nr:hypothetical protein NIES2104_23150 [Leptolyngbya sp. NIES-2104]